MNLGYFTGGKGLEFVRASLDGKTFEAITRAVPGSGHPTIHPDGRHILTDCYQHEKWRRADGSTPLRWIDLEMGTEEELVRMITKTKPVESWLRLDPHPAWTRDWQWVAFNAVPDGTRHVFLADMRSKLA
jgi:Tol biopolymer transport system component